MDLYTFQTITLLLTQLWPKIWQTMETDIYFWHAEWCSYKILQFFRASDCGQSYSSLQRRIIVKRCIAKEHKVFRNKICTLCDMSGCVHKWMSIREGQDICNCRNDSNQSYCTHVTRKLEGYGQELCISIFFGPTYSTMW